MATKGTPADLLSSDINKRVGRDIATSARKKAPSDVPGYVSTNALPLDLHLGGYRFLGGGLPMGRIVEVFGKESSGKSTLATQVMISAQRGNVTRVEWVPDESGLTLPQLVEEQAPPGVVFLLDTEEAFYKDRAQKMGLDLDRCVPLLEGEPEPSIEECFEAIEAAIDAVRARRDLRDVPVVIVWDTIAGVNSEADQIARGRRKVKGKKAGKQQPGQNAKSISQRLREIKGKLAHHSILLIVVNQTYSNIGNQYAPVETPGGKALKFYSSVRIRTARAGAWEESDRKVGIVQKVTLVKSKVCDPDAVFEVDLRFDRGIDDDYTTAHFILDQKDLWAKAGSAKSRKPRAPIAVKKEGQRVKWVAQLPGNNGAASTYYTRRGWTKFLDSHEGLRESIRQSLFDAIVKSRED